MTSLRNARERSPIRRELLLVFATLWVTTFSKMFKGKYDIYTRVLTHIYEKKIYIYLVFAFSTNRIKYHICLKLRQWFGMTTLFLTSWKNWATCEMNLFKSFFQSIFWKVCGPNLIFSIFIITGINTKGLPMFSYVFHFNLQFSLKFTFCCPRDFRIVVWSKNRFHVGANAHLPKILIQGSLQVKRGWSLC